jgi:hypothetical protein
MLYSRTSISGAALRGKKPVRGRCSGRFDSFDRHNVQRLAGVIWERGLYGFSFPPAYRISTVHDWELQIDAWAVLSALNAFVESSDGIKEAQSTALYWKIVVFGELGRSLYLTTCMAAFHSCPKPLNLPQSQLIPSWPIYPHPKFLAIPKLDGFWAQ